MLVTILCSQCKKEMVTSEENAESSGEVLCNDCKTSQVAWGIGDDDIEGEDVIDED